MKVPTSNKCTGGIGQSEIFGSNTVIVVMKSELIVEELPKYDKAYKPKINSLPMIREMIHQASLLAPLTCLEK